MNSNLVKNNEAVGTMDNRSAWFRIWFNSTFYHKLYQYRNETEAAGFIDALLSEFNPKPNASILDLGCGAGRHSKYLASKGFNVTGLDLASASIEKAKEFEAPNLRFRRHDMRVPFGKNLYDYVYSFFTSFGYFESEAENHQVIQNISNALKPGGMVMIDYLNIAPAEEKMVSAEVKNIDGVVYDINRWTDTRHFFKKINIEVPGIGSVSYIERIEKIGLTDFAQLFTHHDLQLENVYGDYALNEYQNQESPRLIVVARKK